MVRRRLKSASFVPGQLLNSSNVQSAIIEPAFFFCPFIKVRIRVYLTVNVRRYPALGPDDLDGLRLWFGPGFSSAYNRRGFGWLIVFKFRCHKRKQQPLIIRLPRPKDNLKLIYGDNLSSGLLGRSYIFRGALAPRGKISRKKSLMENLKQ
jgi:hypothetical protein